MSAPTTGEPVRSRAWHAPTPRALVLVSLYCVGGLLFAGRPGMVLVLPGSLVLLASARRDRSLMWAGAALAIIFLGWLVLTTPIA